MEELIVTLNGKNYLVVELPMSFHQKNIGERIDKICQRHGALWQGFKKISGGFLSLSPSIYAARVLVPEENVIAFNNDKL